MRVGFVADWDERGRVWVQGWEGVVTQGLGAKGSHGRAVGARKGA